MSRAVMNEIGDIGGPYQGIRRDASSVLAAAISSELAFCHRSSSSFGLFVRASIR